MTIQNDRTGRLLSAAVVVGAQRERAGVCVQRLLEQTAIGAMEIVVVDLAPSAPVPASFGDARVLRIAREDAPDYAAARAEAVRRSTGAYIAFLEDHSYPAPGWAAAIIEAFERPVALVNYAFTLANDHGYTTRAMLVAEYGRWMVPARPGPVPIPACNNIAYRREALLPYLDDLDGWLEAEFLLHQRILQAGGGVWLAPDAHLAHECWDDLAAGCRANGAMKRLLADSRVHVEGWGLGRRLLYAAAMAAAPAQSLWRLARSLPGRPGMVREFIVSLPVCAAIYTYSAACEAAGYLAGAGSSRDDFREVELSITRDA
jgi:hypothetical protein